MHKSRLGGFIVDCQGGDLGAHARFWAGALGYTVVGPEAGSGGRYWTLEGPPGEPTVQVQAVDHPSRVHLDVEADDVEAEVRRLEGLGARVAERFPRWVVMEAPSGHRFCVVRAERAGFEAAARPWP